LGAILDAIIRRMGYMRHTNLLARIVLVWFVLSLGAAMASPVLRPQALALVCSGLGAVKLVAASDDGSVPAVSVHTMDCALCFAPGAPPAQQLALAFTFERQPLIAAVRLHNPQSLPTAAPPPARGPPDLS
jgi:hypothetical protein